MERCAWVAIAVMVVGCGRVGFDHYDRISDDRGDLGGPMVDVDAGASGVLEIPASIAECVSPSLPDPSECEESTGRNELNVDEEDGDTGRAHWTFLRFDVEERLRGREIVAVTLRLRTTDNRLADGPTGEVWDVAPFDLDDLFVDAPKRIGAQPIAEESGWAEEDEPVEWTIPASRVRRDAPTHIGIFPLSDEGVNYWNRHGDEPPRLLVTYR